MKNLNEVFVKVDKYENYEISNFGRIKNTSTGKYINGFSRKTSKTKEVRLYRENGKSLGITTFRLVALHFVDNPKGFKNCIPKDRNWSNAKADNIAWVDGDTWIYFCGLNQPDTKKRDKTIDQSIALLDGKINEITLIKEFYETKDFKILQRLFNNNKAGIISKLRAYSQRKSFIEEGLLWVQEKFFSNCVEGKYAGTNLAFWLQKYATHYCNRIEKVWQLREVDAHADMERTETNRVFKYG